jgi:ATP-dependent 26S proteasome regulatory subunit
LTCSNNFPISRRFFLGLQFYGFGEHRYRCPGGEELLLNKLLNEMDGLKEEADILFILTTNRQEALEAALASRPGRVDQAIEFPLPDDPGRSKLVRLYAQGISLSDEVVDEIVRRTDGVSAAFIKELMGFAIGTVPVALRTESTYTVLSSQLLFRRNRTCPDCRDGR